MVDFHRNQSGEESMRKQYEEMRRRFLSELEDLLASFQIEVEIGGAAG